MRGNLFTFLIILIRAEVLDGAERTSTDGAAVITKKHGKVSLSSFLSFNTVALIPPLFCSWMASINCLASWSAESLAPLMTPTPIPTPIPIPPFIFNPSPIAPSTACPALILLFSLPPPPPTAALAAAALAAALFNAAVAEAVSAAVAVAGISALHIERREKKEEKIDR